MKTISWVDAFDLALNYEAENKVTLFMFIDEDCPVCNEFVPTLEELENEDYQVILVDDGKTMPFTLTSYPMGYVYIPNCPTQMPLQRIGNAPVEMMKIDSNLQIQSMKEGRDYVEVRDAYKQARSEKAA